MDTTTTAKTHSPIVSRHYRRAIDYGSISRAIALIAILVWLPATAWGQAAPLVSPMPGHDVAMKVDSGSHFNDGDHPRVVWRRVIRVKEAKWLRLRFQQLVLADDPFDGSRSVLRIRSLRDGAEQQLTAESARQWQNTSAYFNGNAVMLELTAAPNGRMNWIVVDQATAGEAPDRGASTSICDGVDDRVLSNDPRAGRTAPGGCSAWLFNDRANCMLTAGHCASSASVIEFNVPLSNPDGSVNHPPPEDQYPVDPASMQLVNAGIGNDWCYFGCFENSNTGLTAFEAQGDSYQLELPEPVTQGDMIRITGYGTTSPPVDNTWNQAQKTQVGPHLIFSGSQLGYRTDTTGGNSGSPVIFENNGTAIGIHTHGGCSNNGSGNNWGTGANNAGLQNALANPLGVCQSALAFDYPNGRPDRVNPAGGTTMRVVVSNFGEEPQPGTGVLNVDRGNGFESFPMNQISDNVYDAIFPTTTCGSVVNFYVSALDVDGDLFTDPRSAPNAFFSAISAENVTTAFADDFESDLGWIVSGDATDGQWDRGVPAGGGDRGDPPSDGDGSGQCYVTDNADGNSDVDGGSTILTSPIMDATVSGNEEAVVSYYRWYSNVVGNAPESDIFVVEISNDGGGSWTTLEIVGPSGPEVQGGWFYKSFLISDFVAPTDQMALRFNASDLGDGSVVEAGVDGVKIEIIQCDPPIVTADRLNVILGSITQGVLADTFGSDDQYLKVRRGAAASPIFPSIDLEFEGTLSSDSPSELAVKVESSVNSNGITQEIEAFNFDAGQYELIDARATSQNSDSVAQVDLTGDVSRFVEMGTGLVRTRVTYTDDGTGGLIGWTVSLDQFGWIEQ